MFVATNELHSSYFFEEMRFICMRARVFIQLPAGTANGGHMVVQDVLEAEPQPSKLKLVQS